jgi:hypothetical protein
LTPRISKKNNKHHFLLESTVHYITRSLHIFKLLDYYLFLG